MPEEQLFLTLITQKFTTKQTEVFIVHLTTRHDERQIFTLEQNMKAKKGSRGIAILFI